MSALWDGEASRRRMLTLEQNAENYAREHRERLRRGQGNGSAFERDRSSGEAFAYGSLASSAATEHRSTLQAKLQGMLAKPPTPRENVDADAWTTGFVAVVRSLLAEVQEG